MKLTIDVDALLRGRGVAILRRWRAGMDTSPKNQRALQYDAPKAPAREARPGELLFEFERRNDRFSCELRDRGPYGVEAQFLQDGELLTSHRFATRELAVKWAELERDAILASD